MRRHITTLALLALVVCCAPPPCAPVLLDADPCRSAALTLSRGDEPAGGAVAVGPWHAVTAAHGLTLGESLRYGRRWEPSLPLARVEAVDTDRDLALLRLAEPLDRWGHLQLHRTVRHGDPVSFAGSQAATVSDGTAWTVSRETGARRQEIEIDAPMPNGSSGYPLCDATGAVIGLCLGHALDSTQRGYFTPASSIAAFLQRTK